MIINVLSENIISKLEEGSTATTYTPYNETSYIINLGNIEYCNINDTYKDEFYVANGTNNLFSGTFSATSKYLSNDGTENASNNYNISQYIPILPNTSYATSGMTNPGSNPSRCYYNANKEFISGIKHNGGTELIDTSPNNAYYMRESIPIVDINTTMINKGSTALPYEPYGDGTLYLKKNIGKWIFNGTQIVDVGTLKGIFAPSSPPNKIYSANNGVYFERAKFILSSATKHENEMYENPSNVLVLGSETDTLETLQAKFNGGLMYYVLATPTYIPITGTLAEQLEAVFMSKAGQTNISQANNDLPFNINASALLDLNSLVE